MLYIAMRWKAVTIAIMLMAAIAGGAVTTTPSHPYRRQYKRETFGKKALAGVGARAVVGRRGSFGGRVASGMGAHVVHNSIRFGVGAARHEDLQYHRSANRRFGPRMRHALVSTVVTRKTTSGKKTVAAGNISGAMGSGMLLGSGAASGGITLGAAAGVNVAREFWPKKKRKVQARR
jgi:hypothetical protein